MSYTGDNSGCLGNGRKYPGPLNGGKGFFTGLVDASYQGVGEYPEFAGE